MTANTQTSNRGPRQLLTNPWTLLAAATLLMAFTRSHAIPAAYFLALLMYHNFKPGENKKWRRLAGIVLSGTIGGVIAFYGMIPGGVVISGIVHIIWWTLLGLAFLYEHYMVQKIPGFWSTLVLPGLFVLIEYTLASIHPFGSWVSIAYSFMDLTHLSQVASIFGIWGITFAVLWSVSIVSWILNHLSDRPALQMGIVVLGLLWGLVSVYGAGRISIMAHEPSIRVGGVTYDKMEGFTEIEEYVYSMGEEMIDDLAAVKAKGWEINDQLFQHTENLARAGAQIIYWDETSGIVFDGDLEDFYARGIQIAADYHVYLGIKALVFFEQPRDDHKLLKNIVVLITPEGELLGEYAKSFPVPGFEDIVSVKGDKVLPILQTEFGTITHAICFDADFSRLMRQAGQNEVGLILVPSGDWIDIDPYHARMSSYRAIENGATLVHIASGGSSMAFDYLGRMLGSFDYFANAAQNNYEFIFEVPTQHHFTLYAVIGDILPIMCGILLLALSIQVLRRWPGK